MPYSDRIGRLDKPAGASAKTNAGDMHRRELPLLIERSPSSDKLPQSDLRQSRTSGLCRGLQAARAKIATHSTAVLIDSRSLDIRPELPFGLALRKAHVMTAHRPLATHFTFGHNFTLPDALVVGLQTKGDRSVARISTSKRTIAYYRRKPGPLQTKPGVGSNSTSCRFKRILKAKSTFPRPQ